MTSLMIFTHSISNPLPFSNVEVYKSNEKQGIVVFFFCERAWCFYFKAFMP